MEMVCSILSKTVNIVVLVNINIPLAGGNTPPLGGRLCWSVAGPLVPLLPHGDYLGHPEMK